MPTPTDLRRAIADLNTLAAADLRALWRQVSTPAEAREALSDVLPRLVQTYGVAAGTVAADWYDEVRDELNVDGRFSAIVAEFDDDMGADVLARWGIGPLFAEQPDWRRAQVLVDGGLQRRIANVSRQTVMQSAAEDPRAQGWQRAGSGECAFCRMLIDRGTVYTSASVDFGAHDHCNCHAVAAFDGRTKPVKPYTKSRQNISDADRARVRTYINQTYPDVRG